MTALVQDRVTSFAGRLPSRGSYGIKANVQQFKDSIVCLDSAGRAMPGGLISAGCLKAVGKSSAQYDNRTGSSFLSGNADATDVETEYGIFAWANSAGVDAITAVHVGRACYVVDDQTVALTDGGGLRCLAGIITEVRASIPWVLMGPDVVGFLSSSGSAADTAAFTGHGARGASTANIADLAVFTVAGVDGLTYVAGERILLKDQTTASQNGIYVVGTVGGGTAPLTRALDADGATEIVPGMLVHVSAGTVALDSWWALTTNAPITVGTTSLTFAQIPTHANLAATAGAGLVGILDTAGIITGTTVETALAELAAIVSPGGVTKIQVVTGTFVAGLCTVTVGAGQAVTAVTKAFPCMSAVITGSANVGGIAHMIASNVVGGSGVGQVLLRVLDSAGGTDVDAAGLFAAILIN